MLIDQRMQKDQFNADELLNQFRDFQGREDMTPKRAREIGFERQADGSWRMELFTVYVNGTAEHRTYWPGYSPDQPYGLKEAIEHAKAVSVYLSTGRRQVRVLKEITTVEQVFGIRTGEMKKPSHLNKRQLYGVWHFMPGGDYSLCGDAFDGENGEDVGVPTLLIQQATEITCEACLSRIAAVQRLLNLKKER